MGKIIRLKKKPVYLMFFTIFFLLLNSLFVLGIDDYVSETPLEDYVSETPKMDVISEQPKPDDIKEEFMENCGDGICESPETKDRCCEDCGGCFAEVKVAGDEIAEEKEKKGFFSRIIDFFRKLFWKEDKLCKEFCEKSVAHDDCAGGWKVSGTYPDCLCKFVCEAVEEGLPPKKELVDVVGEEEEEEIIDESQYAYTLAEFVQKQQTFSPYTKYEPNFALDKACSKIYYVFKAMDDDDIWQVWTATSDLDGNNWQEVQQTNSKENKQRAGVLYDPKDDLLHYFYQTGNERGAAERITRRLITATKKPDEEKWKDETVLIDNDGIDDTLGTALDSAHHRIILAYTKDQQITTARISLNDGSFKETVHTANAEMSFIPNMAYDESTDTVYLVFPRAREPIPRVFDNKDLWLARLNSDGSNYRETRLTKTDYDNTWPFITLDLPREQFYVYYASFTEPTFYSEEGVANVKERVNLGRANLDGNDWKVLREKNGFGPFGVNPETGVLYGLYEEPYREMHQGEGNTRYFIAYDPNTNQMEKQLIPSGNKQTDYDASHKYWDSESKMIFGAQQVCRSTADRAMECQVWTYYGRILDGETSILTPQTKAEMAPEQPRKLPEFKIIKITRDGGIIKINTNRKLSMPIEIKVMSKGKEVKWEPSQLSSQIDQDRGFELLFPTPLASYEATYKICALSDPENPECQEGIVTWG